MRLKRQKVYKRLMGMYTTTFGFRPPYQVIVDGDFVQLALSQTISLRDQLPKILLAPTKQLSTSCVLAELRKAGEDASGAALMVRRMERRRCQHHPPIPGSECIASIIAKENKHHYCVASQNTKLRDQLRMVPGTPLLYINRAVLILEPPSPATTRAAEQAEKSKMSASTTEIAQAKKLAGNKRKRKVTRSAPNPLSVKKSKVDTEKRAEKNRKKKEAQKRKKLATLQQLAG
ncbi:MAG: Fcf1-domain-containing protein [Piptocephalis tieghemiana]|nr:MAG: Fcf1-domain-containing protein [Piptocephalis tieghemiana]